MFKRIVVPLDGSERAEQAIPVAAYLARASLGSIVLVRVVLPANMPGTFGAEPAIAEEPSPFETELAEAEEYLQRVMTTHANVLAGIVTERAISSGRVSPEIDATASLEEADLIVLCSRGESGLKRWVFSSIAQELVRQSPLPVLVLNEHGVSLPKPESTRPVRMLVPLDGSALSEAVLEPAIQLLKALSMQSRGEMHLLRVMGLLPTYGEFRSQAYFADALLEDASQEAATYVKTVAERLREGPVAGTPIAITSSVISSTDIARTIIKSAEQTDNNEGASAFDLIAMATHGRMGVRRLMMGSVTERVLGATKLPLLVVHPVSQNVHPPKVTQSKQEGSEKAGPEMEP